MEVMKVMKTYPHCFVSFPPRGEKKQWRRVFMTFMTFMS